MKIRVDRAMWKTFQAVLRKQQKSERKYSKIPILKKFRIVITSKQFVEILYL